MSACSWQQSWWKALRWGALAVQQSLFSAAVHTIAVQAQFIDVAAGRLGWSENQRLQLAAELVEGLTAMERLRDAAVVSLEHLKSPDAAVQLFCSAHEWCQVTPSSAPLLLLRWRNACATCLDT